MKTAVLALGGNALSRADEPATVANQFRRARESVAPVVELARQGWRIVVKRGSGSSTVRWSNSSTGDAAL